MSTTPPSSICTGRSASRRSGLLRSHGSRLSRRAIAAGPDRATPLARQALARPRTRHLPLTAVSIILRSTDAPRALRNGGNKG